MVIDDNNVVENNVKVFGKPPVVAPETTTDETIVEKKPTDVESLKLGDQVTEKLKKDEKKPTDVVDEKEKTIDKSKKGKKGETPFKVSFENEVETISKPVDTGKEATISVTEEVVLKYLKDNNLEVDKISDLSKKEELPESVAKFKKFHEETGRGINDFYNAQKDWNKESKDDTIKEFYKYEYDMSDEDIDTQIELLKVSKDDEEELDPRELTKRKLDYSKEYSKALSFMNKKSKEFKTPLDNQVQQKQATPEEIAEAHKPYWKAREKSLGNLNEIKLKIEGIGEINLEVTKEQKELVSKYTETQEAFFSRWQDDKGIIDTDKSSVDVLWSIPEIRQNLISTMLEKANTLILDNFSKNNRNVNLNEIKIIEQEESGASLKVVGDNESKEDRSMGKPLFS